MAHVIVVGAGVVGSAIAYYLSCPGAEVTVIDGGRPLQSPAASGATAAGVRQQRREIPELRLAMHSIGLWEHLADDLGQDMGYFQGGMTTCLTEPEGLSALYQRVNQERSAGLDIRVVEDSELHEMLPLLSREVVAGTYCPSDGYADPFRTTRALIQGAVRHGATVNWETPMLELHTAGDVVKGVITPGGVIAADAVVLAPGSWTARILEMLHVTLPITAGFLQMMITTPLPRELEQVLGWVGHGLSLKQTHDGGYLIGGGWPGSGNPRLRTSHVHPGSMAKSARTVTDLIPALKRARIIRAWVGAESFSADGLPIIDRLDQYQGLYLAAGFTGHGFALAPAVGEQLAGFVLGEPKPSLLEPFSIHRFDQQKGGDVREG